MPDESPKSSRRPYRRRSAIEILNDKKKALESAGEKGRERLKENAKALQGVNSQIAAMERKERSRARDQQAPLIGLVIMHRMHEDPKTRANLTDVLDQCLTMDEHRAAFGFESLTGEERKQRSGLNLDDVEPLTAEELRESRSATRHRSAPRRSNDGNDSRTDEETRS